MENQAAVRVRGAMSRRRPLHTCGASLLAIVHTAYRKAQELNGPIGKWIRWITKSMSLALPLIYAVQYQWLAILSFTDDCILRFEKLVETIFPPSSCLFDRIDKLVYTAEVMPGKFDEALNRFLVIVRRVPFLEWALMEILCWLDGNHMEEKDIMIDMNSNTRSNATESAGNANCPSQGVPSMYCAPQEKIFEVGKPESNAEVPSVYCAPQEKIFEVGKPESNEEVPSVYCAPQEQIFEVGKPESNAELPALAKSENEEKLDSVSDSMENEEKTQKDKYTVESPTANQSGNLISSSEESVNRIQLPSIAAPLGGSSQERRKSVDHVRLPSIAAPIGRSSQDRRKSVGQVEFPTTAASPGNPLQDKSKPVDHVEVPGNGDPLGDSSQEKRISVGHFQLPNTPKKEELPRNKILKDDPSQDKTKSVGVKLESDIVKGAEKETFEKQTKAKNTQEESQKISVSAEKVGRDKEKGTQKSIEDKDPVLELFESRWHL